MHTEKLILKDAECSFLLKCNNYRYARISGFWGKMLPVIMKKPILAHKILTLHIIVHNIGSPIMGCLILCQLVTHDQKFKNRHKAAYLQYSKFVQITLFETQIYD